MKQRPDILILGGGVIGLTTAYFLAREGARVEVLDKGDFGQEASWAGAGILPPADLAHAHTPVELLRAHSAALFPTLSAELHERTGVDNGYLRCGGLEFLGESSDASAHQWRADGVTVEQFSPAAVVRFEPAVATDVGAAVHLPDMGQLRNPRHLKALLAGCASWNVALRAGCPAYGFAAREGRITAVRTAAGDREAGQILIATGAWSEPLLEQAGWRPGIRPVRGQIALLNTGMPLFRRVLLWGARYLVPRPDGRVLIGSTEEDAGFEKRTTAAAVGELLELGCRLVPALAKRHLERCWAGLRPGSPDGLPFLGPVPGYDNLFVAAGHFRSGIQLSPATALGMKELLLGQPLTLPLEPFRLGRDEG